MPIDIPPLTLTVGLVGLCLVSLILLFAVQFVGGFLEIFVMLAQILSDPTGCFGCLVLIVTIGGCIASVFFFNAMLADCDTSAATNFCTLFGR